MVKYRSIFLIFGKWIDLKFPFWGGQYYNRNLLLKYGALRQFILYFYIVMMKAKVMYSQGIKD